MPRAEGDGIWDWRAGLAVAAVVLTVAGAWLAARLAMRSDASAASEPVAQMKGAMAQVGGTLEDRKGRRVSSSVLAQKKYVMFYMSAGWCPPCHRFTPALVQFYDLNRDKGAFEVVFVSHDRAEAEKKKYMEQYGMNWLSVPFKDAATREGLSTRFETRGIPNLVVVDTATGESIITSYINGEYTGPYRVLEDFGRLLKENGVSM